MPVQVRLSAAPQARRATTNGPTSPWIARGSAPRAARAGLNSGAAMWKTVRVSILLLVLFAVGAMAWLDRRRTAAWNQTLWVGVFPMAADDSAVTQRYVADLRAESFAASGEFFAREARRYGVAL